MDDKFIGEVHVLALSGLGRRVFDQTRLEGSSLARHSPHTIHFSLWGTIHPETDGNIKADQSDIESNDLQCVKSQHGN